MFVSPHTPAADTRTALQRFLDIADRHPEFVALRTHDGSASYGELRARALRLAGLVSRRCEPGDRVGVVAGDDQITYTALLATWMAGCAYVPFHRANPESRATEMARDAGTRLVISGSPHPETERAVAATGGSFLVPNPGELVDGPSPAHAAHSVQDPDLAYILFTSGSTGKPKGVPITHGNLTAFLNSWAADPGYALEAGDRALQMFSLCFDLSVMCTFAPLSVGASCHVVSGKGTSYLNIARILQSDRITMATMVPSVLSYLHRFFDELRLPELRHSIFAGEALVHDLTEGWSACVPNARIQNGYGPTEATILCTLYDWERERSARESSTGIVPIGKPMAGFRAVVLDEGDRPASAGEEGELCVQGPQVMSGYWQNPERTVEAFVHAPGSSSGSDASPAYRTGDLVRADPTGSMVWLSRKDFQVKIDGHRIELGEIEAHARELAGTPDVAVVTAQGPGGGMTLALFLAGGSGSEGDLARGLEDLLPTYMQPRQIQRLPELPLNSNGKVDRPALARLAD
jgi:D-alanine--poly(phosphoribitol) ligase subunit 1